VQKLRTKLKEQEKNLSYLISESKIMSLSSRMDKRSKKEFQNQISRDTLKQKIYAEAFRAFLVGKFKTDCTIIDYGVDNTGDIINGNLLNNNVDNIFIWQDKETKIEIKTMPEYLKNFMTFKVCSLKSCIEQKAYILVAKRFKFYLLSPILCKYLKDNYTHKIYEQFSPNDKAVRIFNEDIKKFCLKKILTEKKWPESSRAIIEKNWNFLCLK
jgi:hypothetical protein